MEPFLVPSGWIDSDFIAHTGGPTYRLLTYADGTVRFEHRCDRGYPTTNDPRTGRTS